MENSLLNSHWNDDPQPREEGPVDLENQLAFLNLSEEDIARLQSLLPLFHATEQDFVESFYRHLLKFDETAKFLQDSELVKQLKVLQRDHFESVLDADWDDRFVQRRRRVGQVHAERGIGHLYFLGAYYKFFEHILQRMKASKTRWE